MHYPSHATKLSIAFTIVLAATCLPIKVNAQDHGVSGIETNEEPPKLGLRVLEVNPYSIADKAGLRSMDMIARYGDLAVVDSASYFLAREAYQKFPESKIEIVYWRGRQRLSALISTGELGIRFNDYNPVSYDLDALMQKLNNFLELPGYYSESQVARGAWPSRDKAIEEIDGAIKKGISDGSLTPAQILIARINAIPDDSPAAVTETQSALLTELVSTQPLSFIDYLGYGVFFKHKRYRAAAACFKRTLEARPDDISVRLNMGVAYDNLQMFAEADGVAEYVLKGNTRLSEHGYVIAFQVKAVAALGQRDFAKALDYADQAFRREPSLSYVMMLCQLAAAQNGDLDKFYEVVAANEKAVPEDYARLRSRTDAVEAFLLFRNNQIEKAQALARKSLGTEHSDSDATFWRKFPTGEDIVKVWKQLQSLNN